VARLPETANIMSSRRSELLLLVSSDWAVCRWFARFANPADLQQPTRFQLVINLKAAKIEAQRKPLVERTTATTVYASITSVPLE